jgi:hypothetical protein
VWKRIGQDQKVNSSPSSLPPAYDPLLSYKYVCRLF